VQLGRRRLSSGCGGRRERALGSDSDAHRDSNADTCRARQATEAARETAADLGEGVPLLRARLDDAPSQLSPV
jgi:hypothetical protein